MRKCHCCQTLTLQIGQLVNPKVILGPLQRDVRTVLQQPMKYIYESVCC